MKKKGGSGIQGVTLLGMTENPRFAPHAMSTCAGVTLSLAAISLTSGYSVSIGSPATVQIGADVNIRRMRGIRVNVLLFPSGLYAVKWMLCSLQYATRSSCSRSGCASISFATYSRQHASSMPTIRSQN